MKRFSAARTMLAWLLWLPGTGWAQAPAPTHRFDIPAQRLATALVAFGEASGVDVLLDEPQAADRRTSAVRGTYSAPEALTLLLDGTGLAVRFTSPRSAVVLARGKAAATPGTGGGSATGAMLSLDTMRVSAPRMIGSGPHADIGGFVLTLANRIRQLVIEADVLRAGGATRLRLRTRIDADGVLRDVALMRSDGDVTRDRRIQALLEGAQLGAVPPPGLRQPLLFEVAAQ
jgi:hypothetical protein